MRVVSLVPSLTETLAECGVNLVGRTRFCVHPKRIQELPVVGGTKDLKKEELAALKPDLLILDKEENLPWMLEEAPCKVHVFHATSVEAMTAELIKLAFHFEGAPGAALEQLALRYEAVAERPIPKWNFERIPGRLEKWDEPTARKDIVYVIWKNPWMAVGRGTYIASVLEHLGAGPYLQNLSEEKYPKFETLDPAKYHLFSSEPFPFGKEKTRPGPGSLVDGESYSWFGTRSLQFLEKQKVPSSFS